MREAPGELQQFMSGGDIELISDHGHGENKVRTRRRLAMKGKPEPLEPKLTPSARIVATIIAELDPYVAAPEREWPELIYRLERRAKAILDEEKRGSS